MDKLTIGKFISQRRRDCHLTQEQLAEKLHVTAKAVSKWERGLSLPDFVLYEPLCGILGITVGELFSGGKQYHDDLSEILLQKFYNLSDKSVSFGQFSNAMREIIKISTKLKTFPSKESAVEFLRNETGHLYSECSKAYDFYINLFDEGE